MWAPSEYWSKSFFFFFLPLPWPIRYSSTFSQTQHCQQNQPAALITPFPCLLKSISLLARSADSNRLTDKQKKMKEVFPENRKCRARAGLAFWLWAVNIWCCSQDFKGNAMSEGNWITPENILWRRDENFQCLEIWFRVTIQFRNNYFWFRNYF